MSKNPLVSVNILTYNAQNLIGPCLKSVLSQNYANIQILVIDNASTDNTLEKVKKYQKTNFPIKIIQNEQNVGFTRGHNIGIENSKGKYVLCLNQDVILDKEFVKNTVEAIEVNEDIGAVQGKLYKGKTVEGEYKLEKKILDSTGLLIFKNRRIVARGQGKEDRGQYERGEIFGADGPAPLYRRKALEDVKLPIFKNKKPLTDKFEYFDEDFFMYKEDVDLAWRMQLYNWKTIYEPKAVGYHLRGAGERAVRNYLKVAKARKKISQLAKCHSFKNQRLMQIKNEICSLLLVHFCRIITKEVGSWMYILLFEKYTWKAIKQLFKQAPKAWRKRKIIMTRKRVRAKEIKKWFQ